MTTASLPIYLIILERPLNIAINSNDFINLAGMSGDLNRSMQHFDFRPLKRECRDEIQNTNKVYGRTKGTDMGSLATWRVPEFNWSDI
jgi:hypothetical protein